MTCSTFSCAYWPLVDLLCINVYSNPLLIFKIRWLLLLSCFSPSCRGRGSPPSCGRSCLLSLACAPALYPEPCDALLLPSPARLQTSGSSLTSCVLLLTCSWLSLLSPPAWPDLPSPLCCQNHRPSSRVPRVISCQYIWVLTHL